MKIVRYRASVDRKEDYTMIGKSRKHEVVIDEPYAADTAMNPIELLLNALGACKIAVTLDRAKKLNIEIRDIGVDIVATRSRRDPKKPEEANIEIYTGIEKIETKYRVQSSASEEEISDLISYTDSKCPVGVTLENGVKIESTLKYSEL